MSESEAGAAEQRPSRKRLALGIGAAVVVGLGLFLWLGGSSAPPGPTAGRAGDEEAAASLERTETADDGSVLRSLSVTVLACAGVPHDEIFVVAERDGAEVARATVDSNGQGRLRIPYEVPLDGVEAHFEWRGWRSLAFAVASRGVSIDGCPGAIVRGVVRNAWGQPVPGAVHLVDAAGESRSVATAGADGAYSLEDAELQGVGLIVTAPGAALERGTSHSLPRLEALTVLELDLVIGDGSREIVGWVLDASGEPQAAVAVTLTWVIEGGPEASFHTTRRVMTDAGGGFAFERAPATVLRVTAAGGARGHTSVRVPEDLRERVELSLTLEPSAQLRVNLGEGKPAAEVILRASDPSIHGDAPDAGDSDDAFTAAVAEALAAWDERDEIGSMGRLVIAFSATMPGGAEELRQEAAKERPELARAPLPEVAEALARKALREEPELPRMLKRTGELLKEGVPLDRAADVASSDVRAEAASRRAESERVEEFAPESPTLEDWEEAALEEALAEFEPAEEDSLRPASPARPPARDVEAFGVDAAELHHGGRTHDEIHRGMTGQWLVVRSGFAYDVFIRLPDGRWELPCGRVFLAAGAMTELTCGERMPAVLSGRVVDVEGRPVAGASVSLGYEQEVVLTGADGRFRLEREVSYADVYRLQACQSCDAPGGGLVASRRGLTLLPGQVIDAGTLTLRAARPLDYQPDGSARAAGGSWIEVDGGLSLREVEEDGALFMEGVEAGDRLVRIGAHEAGNIPIEEILEVLEGRAVLDGVGGDSLDLMMRSREGELYPLFFAPWDMPYEPGE